MDKKCLIVQPGAYGDIFLCAPIAKWYTDLGYSVYWPVTNKFLKTLEPFNYVTPILLSDEVLHEDWLRSDVMKTLKLEDSYDLILNLADRGPHPTAQQPYENFEQCKYRLAGVPLSQKNKLVWNRNIERENSLIKHLGVENKDRFALIHRTDSRNETTAVPNTVLKTIEVTPIEGYQIVDWFGVAKLATEIYVIESAIHQFLDGVVEQLTENRFILKRSCVENGYRFTVSANWKLDFAGKLIRG